MKKHPIPVHQIELRIQELSELFNSMDPTPFHHCDLDRDAQEYLESWAMGFSPKSHFRIIVHIGRIPSTNIAYIAYHFKKGYPICRLNT